MYKVIGKVASRTFRVVWMLEEIGQPYELLQVMPGSDEVLAVNPSGKVPVLQMGGANITDSTAIMTYLGDKHAALTYPAGTVERAQQDSMTQSILDDIDAVLWTAARHSFILPEEHRVAEVKPSLEWEFARNLERLGNRFQGPFLMGEKMTIADIICTHCLNWAFSAGFPIENNTLKAYTKAMRARDAFKRTGAIAAS